MIEELTAERPSIRSNVKPPHRSHLSARYEALVHRIQASSSDTTVGQSIGVISCAPRAGVSTVALNIATTAERAGYGPVLLINADINKLPSPNAAGEIPAWGLTDALAGTAAPLDCVTTVAGSELAVVAGRGVRPHNVSTVDRTRFATLLSEYRKQFKLLVVDFPAASDLNDSVALAGQLDGVLLVIEAERADGRVALKTKQQLVDANANLLGVVLNKRQQHLPGWLYRRL